MCVSFFQPDVALDTLSTIIQLEKTILQLDRYGDIIRDIIDDLKRSILSPISSTSPKSKKRLLLHRRKILLGRENDVFAQKERLFTLLTAIQKSVHIQMTVQAIDLANRELKRLHIDNIESTINQMDDQLFIQAEISSNFCKDSDQTLADDELDRQLALLSDELSTPEDISLPLCPTKEPVNKCVDSRSPKSRQTSV